MRDTLLGEMLTLSRWDQLDLSAQEEVSHAVAARLPELFRFDGLEEHELGQQRHRVAFFTWNEARFALIPGGPATLGYEPGSFRPTAAQRASWEDTCHAYPEILLKSPTLVQYLENRLTPLRQVTFRPLLLETVATDLAPRVLDPIGPRDVQRDSLAEQYLVTNAFRILRTGSNEEPHNVPIWSSCPVTPLAFPSGRRD